MRSCEAGVHLKSVTSSSQIFENPIHVFVLVAGEPTFLPTKPLFLVTQVSPLQPTFAVGDDVSVAIDVTVEALEPVTCSAVSVALTRREDDVSRQHRRNVSNVSVASFASVGSSGSLDVTDAVGAQASLSPLQTIELTPLVEMAPNRKRMAACSLRSRVNLRRLDSGSRSEAVIEKEVAPADFTHCLTKNDVTLAPGHNRVIVSGKVCSHCVK